MTRFLPFHRLLVVIGVITIFLWSFLLGGCTSSNGLRNVYLFALSYNNADPGTSDSLLINKNITRILESQVSGSARNIREVRVGYSALCVAFDSGIWYCNTNGKELATLISDVNGDPLNLLRLAERVRTGAFFYPLIIITIVLTFICICIIGTFPSWTREINDEGSLVEVKPFPSRIILYCSLVISGLATLLGLFSALWQHTSSAGASVLTRLLTYDLVIAQVGSTGVAIGWLAAGFNAIMATGFVLLYLSTKLFQEVGME